jgi:hypothetical protein
VEKDLAELIGTLLTTLGEIVNSDSPWKEKRDAILKECTDNDRTNLAEFSAWFPDEEDEDEDEDEDEEDEDEDEDEDKKDE